ncbi:MAG: hypothetical protein GXO64_03435 [Candidatus Micrarchaeota archaeon]|nr:hypothetical protein [Candidatus Micrarchaeota archaeon]
MVRITNYLSLGALALTLGVSYVPEVRDFVQNGHPYISSFFQHPVRGVIVPLYSLGRIIDKILDKNATLGDKISDIAAYSLFATLGASNYEPYSHSIGIAEKITNIAHKYLPGVVFLSLIPDTSRFLNKMKKKIRK